MGVPGSEGWCRATAELLQMAHLLQPSALAAAVNSAVRPLGVEITVYLVDLEQRNLHALPEPPKPNPPPLPVQATMAGRSFMNVEVFTVAGPPDRLWVPVLNGTERYGVLEVLLPEHLDAYNPGVRDGAMQVSSLVGHLLTSKSENGDSLHRVRRSRPMTTAAELMSTLLPPLTFVCDTLSIGAILEPCYEVGGDAFDYAVDDDLARFAVFDAVGHGLRAGVTCAVGLTATRAARRDDHGLYAMARAADEALTDQFSDSRFVTAVLAELQLGTGLVRYLNAGHPPPILLRRGKAVSTLDGGRRMPLGLDDPTIQVAEAFLEPEDRLLLYTDGVVEARDSEGGPFTVDRLVDLAERNAAAALPVAETLRRLSHAVLAHQQGRLQDDATLLLVEWSRTGPERSLP